MHPLKKLERAVDSHVRSSDGVSNKFLERVAKELCSTDFMGVFAADRIPTRVLSPKPRFLIIVNLGERRGRRDALPVGHFVAIYATADKIRYMDPYGMTCYQPKVKRFLELCNREVHCLRRQVQDMRSTYCGFFSLLFLLYLDKQDSRNIPFRLEFYRQRDKLLRNDALCVKYIRKLIYL